MERNGALDGLRVLDISDGIAGQFSARVLADFGADVYLVEPEGGSPVRRAWPMSKKDPSISLLFRHLNTGKHSIALDRGSDAGKDRIRQLAERADVAIVATQDEAQQLRAHHDHLVVAVATDFAPSGPYAEWRGNAMIHEALSGLMHSTGLPDMQPLYGFGHRPYYSAGAALTCAVLAAVLERNRSGQGDLVSVNVHETAVAMSQNLVAMYSYNGYVPPRGRYPGPCDLFQACDGWVVIFCLAERWAGMCQALDAPELAADSRYQNGELLGANWDSARSELSMRLRRLSSQEIVEKVLNSRVPAAPVLTFADLLKEDHLNGRNFWERLPLQEGDALVLGPLFRMMGTPRVLSRLEPRLGSFSIDQIDKLDKRPAQANAAQAAPPLSGLRVVEFTTAWAGPFAGRVLSLLGAEVIKVESLDAIDMWRGSMKGSLLFRYPDCEPGAKPYNRSSWFNSQNQSKLSIEVDLKSESGLKQIRQLLATADIVVSNYAGGVLQRLGLGYEELRKLRDDLIFIEMPAFGSGGTLAKAPGVGPTMEALSGINAQMGYGDGKPQRTGPAFVDPIGGWCGAMAALVALNARANGKGGQAIEIAQREGLLHWIGEYFLLADEAAGMPPADGNRVPYAAPHEAFRTAGEDEWIAIAVETDEQWLHLCQVLDRPDLSVDPRFATLIDRQRHAGELAQQINESTVQSDRSDLAMRLQACGVMAAPICSAEDIHSDKQLASAGFFLELEHPEAGLHRYHGMPLRFSRIELDLPRPAPCLGQDTDSVLERGEMLRSGANREVDPIGAAV